MSKKYKIGDELAVTIEKIVPQGFGLGFAESLTVFVSLAARGDRLKVKITHLKGRVAFAEIAAVVAAGPARVAPGCAYFGRCGGCDFQQLSYPEQLAAKIEIVRDSLTRIGKINYEKEIQVVGSPREYGYRARARWHLDTRRRRFGYYKRNSREIIDVETCPILAPEMQAALTDLRRGVEWTSFLGETVEIEAAAAGGEISVYSDELIEPTREIFHASTAGDEYAYAADGFFQGNPFLIDALIEAATSGASGAAALDLYCGVGLFTLPLAAKFGSVQGVEAGARALGHAAKNVENAGLENVRLHPEPVGEWLSANKEDLKNLDFVLLDPPRAGAERATVDALVELAPRQISYVACDPAVLARDLRVLTGGGYAIDSITALDLFPQTHHVETVIRLNLAS